MPSRRDQIKLTDEEQRELIDSERIVVVSSLGPRGWPHVMPLWYVLRADRVWLWTWRKSQKVKNLERDPRLTLQIEDGLRYEELRGVMLRCEARLHRDEDDVRALGYELADRYGLPRDTWESDAAKGICVECVEVGRRIAWDYRKLPS